MALPVVCTDADGLPENVADGVTGFVVPRRDPEAMAERLTALASDPELRWRMGRAGRQRVLKRFDLARQIDSFAAFYEQVLGEGPRRRLDPARPEISEPFAGSLP
jgi:colanic acid/amylovoran biosynthesis glycosyltransferase